jgi:ring-1,2-phenylacetyl-CoA epoxidase subunit PaaB
MIELRKYYYGDYDAIKGGAGSDDSANSAAHAGAPLPLGKGLGDGSKGDGSGQGSGSGSAPWPLWEIFIRSKQGLDHKHVGSLHAADAAMAIENARDVYTRRQEGVSIWVVESKFIHASNPDEADSFYEPANDKVYRHPTFYDLPDELTHM